jgi:hypothetical protein
MRKLQRVSPLTTRAATGTVWVCPASSTYWPAHAQGAAHSHSKPTQPTLVLIAHPSTKTFD